IKGPKLLHIVTKKGKGYIPAEREPIRFHSTGPFELSSGLPKPEKKTLLKTYTQVFSDKLIELAKKNKKIIAITAAMPQGTGLDKFRNLFPDRFFDVGIAEAHAVCFAAGLAKGGLKPVVAIYSTFLQRAYDQIIEDVALQEAGVVFCVDRAGIVGEDGVTHQGIFDIIFLKNIPNLVVMEPKDAFELEKMLEFALNLDKPIAIRYPKSVCPSSPFSQFRPIELGKAELLKEGKDFVLIAFGSLVMPAYEAVESLKEGNLSGTLINARFAQPIDENLFRSVSANAKFVFTAEEGIVDSGFGSAVAEAIGKPVVRIGLPLEFVPHGARDLLLKKYGLDAQAIADKIKKTILNE
ncbi:MAG: 1-deoxy-D-xylulose-5-phosphate synthase, partial [Candidatus Omnitrophica bacterium]|nr:1-deoxy-D-xylulose-5-phosphate synthase [Candidatus Omnitrophota bacterium]